MTKCKSCGEKLLLFPYLLGESDEEDEKPQLGLLNSGPKFEPGTSQIRSTITIRVTQLIVTIFTAQASRSYVLRHWRCSVNWSGVVGVNNTFQIWSFSLLQLRWSTHRCGYFCPVNSWAFCQHAMSGSRMASTEWSKCAAVKQIRSCMSFYRLRALITIPSTL